MALPMARVPAAIIMLDHCTPFFIPSAKFNKGFPSNEIIEYRIIPSIGGIAVPIRLICVTAGKISFNKLGRTHKATTKQNTARIVFSFFSIGFNSFFKKEISIFFI